MARPRMAMGTTGNIKTTGQVQQPSGTWVSAPTGSKATRYKARCSVRDHDGKLRDVTRFARTKSRATADLQRALAERVVPVADASLRREMTLADAAEVWLAQVDRPDSDLSPNTRTQYRDAYRRHVAESRIAQLSLAEVNRVQVLERFVQDVADRSGTGSAKTARTVVSSVLRLAVRYGALPFNAMREVRPAKGTAKGTARDTSRALTRDERAHLLSVTDQHGGAQRADVADIVWWLAGTGVRISEALGQRWEDVDLVTGRARVRGTKSLAADRELTLPATLLERVQRRADAGGQDGLVFASPGTSDRSKPRDRRNVARVFREVLDEAGFHWATPHSLRRTVATLLDQAGLPISVAADQLGHANPAMTARVYLGRRGDLSAAAAALE